MVLLCFICAQAEASIKSPDAMISEAGFVRVKNSHAISTAVRHEGSYARAADGAQLHVEWGRTTPEAAAKTWKNVLSNMSGSRQRHFLPPSGKPLGEDWRCVSGEKTGVWSLKAKENGSVISIQLMNPALRRGLKVVPAIDGQLVECLARAFLVDGAIADEAVGRSVVTWSLAGVQ